MSTEDEFTRYKQLYEELQQRVARLSLYHNLFDQVRSRIEELSRQVEEFPGLEEFRAELESLASTPEEMSLECVERPCARCGKLFLTHMDTDVCPHCEDED
jgi:rubrerythrin